LNSALAAAAAAEPEVVPEGRDLTFGQYLRRERILRGISVDEIVRVTKVSAEYYEALENNHFEQLPPQAFVVGFLRVLSRYAGLDGDEVVNRFLGCRAMNRSDGDTASSGLMRRRWRRILVACGFACLVILMFLPLMRA
jgi:cytoskeletal protein RodZ